MKIYAIKIYEGSYKFWIFSPIIFFYYYYFFLTWTYQHCSLLFLSHIIDILNVKKELELDLINLRNHIFRFIVLQLLKFN